MVSNQRVGAIRAGILMPWLVVILVIQSCGPGSDDDDATADDDSSPVLDDDTTPSPDDDSTPIPDDDTTPVPDDDSTPVLDDDTTPLDDDTTPVPDDDTSAGSDADGDGYAEPGDCDDTDAAIHPGATESCDGRDEDCDGLVDDEVGSPPLWYGDGDSDGFGDSAVTMAGCVAAEGYVDTPGDCDDTDGNVHPGAIDESCNGVDENCDSLDFCALEGDIDISLADAATWLTGVGHEDLDLAAAGDVNGDGFGDFLVGFLGSGWSALVHGPVEGEFDLASSGTAFLPEINYEDGAGVVGGPVDLNGDGYHDVIIGAPAYPSDVGDGAVYVVYGPTAGGMISLGDAEGIIHGEWEGLGKSVDGAGDMDGDGVDELIVGAWSAPEGGAAYVFRGPVSGILDTSAAIAEITASEGHYGQIGTFVSGDVNVDGGGVGAVLVGSRYEGAYLFDGLPLGSYSTDDATTHFVPEGGLGSIDCGVFVGDVSGDGQGDILLGESGLWYGGLQSGGAYLIDEAVAGDVDLGAVGTWLVGGSDQEDAGGSVASAGDVDGDGFVDVLVGASLFDGAEENEGRAYLQYGPVSGTVELAHSSARFGGPSSCQTGYAVSGAGDVNADGYDDILIAARGNSYEGCDAAVYLFHGRPR